MDDPCAENDNPSVSEPDQSTAQELSPEDMISFRVVWNKKNYEVHFNSKDTVGNLKKHIESLTGWRLDHLVYCVINCSVHVLHSFQKLNTWGG